MSKAFYKCATCVYHKVDLEKEKCTCILEKLNPNNKNMLRTGDFDMYHGTEIIISGGFPIYEQTKHFHQWICINNYKFLNCPGYKKDET